MSCFVQRAESSDLADIIVGEPQSLSLSCLGVFHCLFIDFLHQHDRSAGKRLGSILSVTFLALVEMHRDAGDFREGVDALGRPQTPLELRILGALRILGRAITSQHKALRAHLLGWPCMQIKSSQ